MSVSEVRIDLPAERSAISPLLRLTAALTAAGIVAIGLAVLSWLLLASGLLPSPAARNPFGTGAGGYAPATGGLGGFILMLQAYFYAALTEAVRALKSEAAAMTSLASVGFLYGIFHAAGPGHGKGVISAYIVAKERSVWRGLALSLSAALLQAAVAILLVAVLAVMLQATAASINATAHVIEMASFAAVAVLGAVLLWSKAGEFVTLVLSWRGAPAAAEFGGFNRKMACRPPTDVMADLREFIGVVLAAGIRPCSGAIILLVFSLSQGLFIAGVVGALAMALGTFITTGSLASLAVFARNMAGRLARIHGPAGGLAIAGVELLAAAFVLMLGLVLLAGVWTGGIPGFLD